MTGDIVIFGAGGHAKVVIEALRAAFPDVPLTVLDDSPGDRRVLGLPVAGDRTWFTRHREYRGVVPALGNNVRRAELLAWFTSRRIPLLSIVHPSAVFSATAAIGCGVFIAPGAVINAEARLGDGVIVNTMASVDHDCEIGSAVHVAPGAHLCGSVQVGARTLIGAGATVIPGVRIGADAVVGAGSVVIRDVPDNARIVGVPARPA